MPRFILTLIAAMLTVRLPAEAQHMNEKDSPCANVVVTVDLANCLAKARDAADAQLNAVYKQLRGKLTALMGSGFWRRSVYGFNIGTRTVRRSVTFTRAARQRSPFTWRAWKR